MTLQELIDRFRADSGDTAKPYFCSDADVTIWLNEAVDEAVIRGRLLIEDLDPTYCEIPVVAGQGAYLLHEKVYEIAHQRFIAAGSSQVTPLKLVSRERLDQIAPGWRDLPAGCPRWAIQTDLGLRLVPVPSSAGMVRLEAYRLPLNCMRLGAKTVPEIHEAHHRHLVKWALHKGFAIPDADFFDAGRSKLHLDEFEQYFGLRPDVDLRRSTREDEVQTTEVQIL